MTNIKKHIEYCTYDNDDIKYTPSFPLIWLPHKANSGPQFCISCRENGMRNEIFYCYCMQCLRDIYNNKRGEPAHLNMKEMVDNDYTIQNYFEFYYSSINVNEGVYYKNDKNPNMYETPNIYEIEEIKTCVECDDIMSPDNINEYIKDNQKLCNECRFFPDHENWPPIGY
jgi:hypothetical protein